MRFDRLTHLHVCTVLNYRNSLKGEAPEIEPKRTAHSPAMQSNRAKLGPLTGTTFF